MTTQQQVPEAEPTRIYMHDSLPRTGHIRVHTLPDLGPRWTDEYIFVARDGKRR